MSISPSRAASNSNANGSNINFLFGFLGLSGFIKIGGGIDSGGTLTKTGTTLISKSSDSLSKDDCDKVEPVPLHKSVCVSFISSMSANESSKSSGSDGLLSAED